MRFDRRPLLSHSRLNRRPNRVLFSLNFFLDLRSRGFKHRIGPMIPGYAREAD
jgi:hypothetical protein